MKQDNAFTGLEAAIVLIAFVVVAAIFSYVMLGAGFFATQKAQEVTYAGIKQSTSNVVIDGGIYANASAGNLTGFMFNVRIPLGGDAVDMDKTEFVFSSSKHPIPRFLNTEQATTTNVGNPFTYSTVDYTIKGYYPTTTSTILTSGESATFLVTITNVGGGGSGSTPDESIGAKEWFSLEMKPRVGAATLISKTIGSGLQTGDTI
jgi:flagellin FlaB